MLSHLNQLNRINSSLTLLVVIVSVLVHWHLATMSKESDNATLNIPQSDIPATDNSNISINDLNQISSPPPSSWSSRWSVVHRLSILAVGDSLTQRGSTIDGWLTMINNLYQRKGDVINRGYSGYNSDWVAELVDRMVTDNVWPFAEKQVVILCLGANDAVFESMKQHVPIERFKTNIIRLIAQLTSHGAQLVLVTPPATDGLGWAQFQKERDGTAELFISRSTEHTNKYADAIREIGQQLSLPVVDTFALLSSEEQPNPYLVDGLHYNTVGDQLVFEAIVKAIDAKWPHLSVAQLPMDGPLHNDLSPSTYVGMIKEAAAE